MGLKSRVVTKPEARPKRPLKVVSEQQNSPMDFLQRAADDSFRGLRGSVFQTKMTEGKIYFFITLRNDCTQ